MDKKGTIYYSKMPHLIYYVFMAIMAIISIIVIYNIAGGTARNIFEASRNISGSGLPMASLFRMSGPVILSYTAILLMTIITIISVGMKWKER